MGRTLLLFRHGHAESERGRADVERALDERGRTDTVRSARAVSAADYAVDWILASAAQRTRQTAALIAHELGIDAHRIQYESVLYLASAVTLLQVLRDCPADSRTVLVVGHNPGLSDLARRFDAGRTGIELSTAGVCAITLDDRPWAALAPHAAPWKILA